MGRVVGRRRVVRINGTRRSVAPDTVAGEEPLEIRVGGQPLAVTMRTPGDDFDLVAGFLVTEGVVGRASEIARMRYCADGDRATGTQGLHNNYNVVDVDLAVGVEPPSERVRRNFYISSSCGVCGKASVASVRTAGRYEVAEDPVRLAPSVLSSLPELLRESQRVFERTGGLHAAGLFTADGRLLAAREDVGRHNAVDKLVGWALRGDRLPLTGRILLVSGRTSFELTQKAYLAGIPVLAAVSAPSTLAVDLAAEVGITLVGFLRGDTMNVYAGSWRIAE